MSLELVRVSQEIAGAHRDIFAHQGALRGVLADLAARPLEERLPQQQEFMARSEIQEAQLELLREKLKVLQDLRREKTSEFGKIRSARETMEKLREKAVQKYA